MSAAIAAIANDNYDDGVLSNPERCALFLDMDGTLLEMAPSPESVRVPSGLVNLLQTIANGLDGALAILTGRQIVEADHLLQPLLLPASGVHGAQVRAIAGGPIELRSPELPAELVAQLMALEGRMPGVRAEAKGPGFAMHYRVVPHVEDALEAYLLQLLEHYAGQVVLSRGRKIFEILPIGLTKGTALTAFAELPAFRGRIPVMIGDDVGDEPAFVAAHHLGGVSLRVAGEHFRPELSDLTGPADVHGLLMRVAERLQARS